MKGSFEISISRKRGVKYDFAVKRNITVIRGDSGSGKTTLFDMVADHMRYGDQSGVTLRCERPCVALVDTNWQVQLSSFSDSIVFVDEGFKGLLSHEFAEAVKRSTNYYVLITRADLPSLPYSVNEVYRIKGSGKFHSLVPLYESHEGHRYSASSVAPAPHYDVLLTEDSKSGFQFYGRRFAGADIACESARSNANVLNWLDANLKRKIFVVADGAAFGAYADRVIKLQAAHSESMTVCLPESFEWLLMHSGMLGSDEVDRMLEDPGSHIESSEYASWEQFFTAYLKRQTEGTRFAYSKSELAEAYSVEKNASKAMALIACGNIR